ncbi:MAG TPA: aminoacyl-tRNA hydrolase [Methylomirabilota bacterium]|nr:aminoacyl-tRNA hydrolase [Methylomirabilota bacterium]
MAVELVLGLGNPGPRYAATRHNVGFRVADELVRRAGAPAWREHPLCLLTTARLAREVSVAKPLTYMNLSGSALLWLLERFGLAPAEVLVVVDDIDLPLGRLRLRPRGGPGTHNGLRDLCDAVGTDFPRLRVGVAAGDEAPLDLADWVTSPFEAHQLEAASAAVERAADAVETAIADGITAAMNRFNRTPQPDLDDDGGAAPETER